MTAPTERGLGAVAGPPVATMTTAPATAAESGEGKDRQARAKIKKPWVEELKKAVEADKGEGNSAIADSDEESDIEAPPAPVHRRQRHQAEPARPHQGQRVVVEGRDERYASVESAVAFLREHGVDARDFASK